MKGAPTSVVPAAAGTLLAAAFCALWAAGAAPTNAEPRLVESTPSDGAVIPAPPESVRLCFSEPVKTEDDDWTFSMLAPGGQALGLRIVFETDSACVDVFPGVPGDSSEGIWSMDWLVRAQSDASEKSGTLRFQVGELQPGETPLPEPKEVPEPAGGDDDAPTALIALAAIGVAIVVLAGGAFAFRRLRRGGRNAA